MRLSLSKGIGAAAALGVLAASIAAFNVPFLNAGLKNGVYLVLGPMQQSVWFAGAQVSGFFGSVAGINSSAQENVRLRSQVEELLAKNAQISDLEKENDYLRQGLNLELGKDFDLKMADIVAKSVSEDTIIIDKGSKDMVQPGMPVITSERAVVGKISKVYDDFSEVELVTGKKLSFDVKIGDTLIDGLAKGQGDMRTIIDLVPKDKELKSGDAVVTSRMGGIFPAGLLIGTINNIKKNDVETFQSADVSLAFDINCASRVFIANAKYPVSLDVAPAGQNKK